MSGPLVDYLSIDGEDDLTRVAFGIVELVGDELLEAILAQADISLDGEVHYGYHSKIDPGATRTPDVLLETEEGTVMIEVKRGRSVNVPQLEEELYDLRRHGGDAGELLLITGHDEPPPELGPTNLDDVRWLGWRDVAIALSSIDASSLSETQLALARMLRTKLEEEGYIPFAGMEPSLLTEVADASTALERYYQQINTFNRDLAGRLDGHGLQPKNLWRDGVSQDLHRFPSPSRFITDHLWIAYGAAGEEVRNKRGRYLFVAFCWPGGGAPTVRAGYTFSPGYRQADRQWLSTHVGELAQFLDRPDYRVIRTSWGFATREAFVDGQEIRPILGDAETLAGFDRIQLVADYGEDRLSEAGITDAVASELVRIHELVGGG